MYIELDGIAVNILNLILLGPWWCARVLLEHIVECYR